MPRKKGGARRIGFTLILILSTLLGHTGLEPGLQTALALPSSGYQTLQLFFENDLFGDTDKYYTNAVQATWLYKDLKEYRDDLRLPQWMLPLIRSAPFVNDPQSVHNVGLILGQHIYTPSDISTSQPLPQDRPYAGFLYTGLALHSKTRTQLDTLEAVLGVVGPSALGEEAQNRVHRLRNIDQAQGWEHQLQDEPALRLAWQRKWRMWQWNSACCLGADAIPFAGLTLGNVRTGANLGGEVRFGYRLPQDFGSDLIRPGAGVSAPVLTGPQLNPLGRFGLHLFAATQVQYVAQNIFLDGNIWRNSQSVSKKPVVADLSLGCALSFERFKITYRHILRTREFDHQDDSQMVGSLTLTLAF